jgi:hypothetical protein
MLRALYMTAYDSIDGVSFLALERNTTFTAPSSGAGAFVGTMLGYAHFGPDDGQEIGDDLLPVAAAGAGAQGFTAPLVGPSLTFWIQQTGDPSTFTLNFFVVPEPASALLACSAIGLIAATRRRRRA